MKNCFKYFLFAILFVCTIPVLAQHAPTQTLDSRLTAHGIVSDAVSGKPIQGVRITAGTYNAMSDEAGAYRIKLPSRMVSLRFALDGYVQKNVPLQGDSILNISLYSEAFGSSKSGDALTNTTSLAMDGELAMRWGSDVRSISRSATAASGSNLFIRGYNSLNANAQPLMVVDGTIWDEQNITGSIFDGFYQNPLADIDVNDIESVEVVKDASSLYGSKGANGVIRIQTKRGRSNVTRIAADISYGYNQAPASYRVMDASQYRTYLSEIMKGTSSAATLTTTFNGIFGMDKNTAEYTTFHNEHHWSDNVFRNGNTQHYGINVQGGDDVAKYSISLGYAGNKGTVQSTGFSRLNTRINSDVYLHPRLTLETSIYFTYMSRQLQDDGVNAYTSPTHLADIKAPFFIAKRYTDDGTVLTNTLNEVDALGVSNPVSLLENAANSNKHYRFGVSLSPVWKINDQWRLSSRFTYTLSNTKEHYFSPLSGVATQYVNGQAWRNTIKDQTMSQNNLYGNLQLNYGKNFGTDHRLDAFAGYRLLNTSFKSAYEDGHNSGNDKVVNMNSSLSYRSVDGANTSWNSVALYAQGTYSFQERYRAWLTLSEDVSSRFGDQAEGAIRFLNGSWATFPSAGLSWLVSNESFMHGMNVLNHLNLRTSYGLTGNDDLDGMNRYAYLTTINYRGAATGLHLNGLANSALKWETTAKFNAGIDLAAWNDLLTINLDYYQHQTNDLLTVKQAPMVSGLQNFVCNGGQLSNRGVELQVGLRMVNLEKLKWNTEFSVAHFSNRIEALPDGDYTTPILGGEVLTSIGNPAGLFYGYKTLGVFRTSDEASLAGLKMQNDDATYSSFGPGDVHFVDAFNDRIINDRDKRIIGNPNPDLTGSLSNRLTMGPFVLDVLCTYSLGNDVYNYKRQALEGMTSLYNQSAAVLNRWKTEGQTTSMPKAVFGDPLGNSRFSDRWIEDGSYLKVKQAKLSYTLPVNSLYLKGLTVWAACTNLYTFTKYLGIDPEVSINRNVLYQGIDNGVLADGRSFYMGVKFNL
jgi:TonB-linked SusC/RagA family outer membrane protein